MPDWAVMKHTEEDMNFRDNVKVHVQGSVVDGSDPKKSRKKKVVKSGPVEVTQQFHPDVIAMARSIDIDWVQRVDRERSSYYEIVLK